VRSVGSQFRHCLDFVSAFVAGIRCGQIDYTCRERDINVARNPPQAISRLAFAIRELQSLREEDFERPVTVRLEERDEWAWSSAKRELDFVQSHTIHHFALIAEKLRAQDFYVDENFGVASSTMKFWREGNANSETA
jgi:hypothetical protein